MDRMTDNKVFATLQVEILNFWMNNKVTFLIKNQKLAIETNVIFNLKVSKLQILKYTLTSANLWNPQESNINDQT